MGVNLTKEEYANMIRERDEAVKRSGSILRVFGEARSNISKKKATNPDERRLLNEILDMVDASMNKI